MNLDTIQQHARSIADALKAHAELTEVQGEAAVTKRKQLEDYILKLTQGIQKCVDEERENL